MDIYQTEDEQVEALKKWWEENGKSVIFGLCIGVVAIAIGVTVVAVRMSPVADLYARGKAVR